MFDFTHEFRVIVHAMRTAYSQFGTEGKIPAAEFCNLFFTTFGDIHLDAIDVYDELRSVWVKHMDALRTETPVEHQDAFEALYDAVKTSEQFESFPVQVAHNFLHLHSFQSDSSVI